jgi:hypothetical protein
MCIEGPAEIASVVIVAMAVAAFGFKAILSNADTLPIVVSLVGIFQFVKCHLT